MWPTVSFQKLNALDLPNFQIQVPHKKFLKEHVIYFIWWTLLSFPFILKATSGQILKNNNCCFFEQDLAYSSNTLYASFYADFCCCDSISFLKIKLNLKVEEIYREKSSCSHKFLGKKCHCTRFLFSII